MHNLSIGINRYLSRRPETAAIPSAATDRAVRNGWLFALAGILVGLMVSDLGSRLDGAAIAILGFAPLMLALEGRWFPGMLIGPLKLMYLYHALGYGLGLMWQSHVIGRLNGIEEFMIPAQWGGVLGLIIVAVVFPFIFSWAVKLFTPKPNSAGVFRDSNWKIYTLMLILVVGFNLAYGFFSGSANRLGGLSRGSLGSSSIYSALSPLQNPLFFFLGYLAARGRGRWMVLWLAVFVSFSVFYFLEGSRSAVALAAIASGIGWVWNGTSMRKVLLIGLLAIVGFVPVAGIILNYRDNVQASGTQLRPRVKALLDAASTFHRFQVNSLAESTAAFARSVTAESVDRVFLLNSYGVSFVGLEGIEDVIYAVTPQIINPNRPDLNDGNRLVILYGGANPGSTGSYMPTVGDGYRRGGWVGVGLLYAWIATIFAVATAVCWSRRDRPEWMGMFIFLVFQSSQIWSTTMLSSFYLLLWIIPRSLVVFLVLGWVGRSLYEVHHRLVGRR